MESLIARVILVTLITVGGGILWRKMWVERLPTVAAALGWLTACAVIGGFCSGYLLFGDPEVGSGNRLRIWLPFPLLIGMVYIVIPSLLRLFRALRGSGTRRLVAWLGLGIVLGMASLSPLAVLWHYLMTQ